MRRTKNGIKTPTNEPKGREGGREKGENGEKKGEGSWEGTKGREGEKKYPDGTLYDYKKNCTLIQLVKGLLTEVWVNNTEVTVCV